jgi:hypothetical protein
MVRVPNLIGSVTILQVPSFPDSSVITVLFFVFFNVTVHPSIGSLLKASNS